MKRKRKREQWSCHYTQANGEQQRETADQSRKPVESRSI